MPSRNGNEHIHLNRGYCAAPEIHANGTGFRGFHSYALGMPSSLNDHFVEMQARFTKLAPGLSGNTKSAWFVF